MKQMTFEEAYLKIITEGELFGSDDNFTSKYKKNTKIFAKITVESDGLKRDDPFMALLKVFKNFEKPKPISDLESELEEFKKSNGFKKIEEKYPPEKKEGETPANNTPTNQEGEKPANDSKTLHISTDNTEGSKTPPSSGDGAGAPAPEDKSK